MSKKKSKVFRSKTVRMDGLAMNERILKGWAKGLSKAEYSKLEKQYWKLVENVNSPKKAA